MSYSCTNNFLKIINTYTEVIWKYYVQLDVNNNCNCKTKINCPMNGLCNSDNIVYQAIIFPKENIKDKKKLILEFHWLNGN